MDLLEEQRGEDLGFTFFFRRVSRPAEDLLDQARVQIGEDGPAEFRDGDAVLMLEQYVSDLVNDDVLAVQRSGTGQTVDVVHGRGPDQRTAGKLGGQPTAVDLLQVDAAAPPVLEAAEELIDTKRGRDHPFLVKLFDQVAAPTGSGL